MGSEGTLITTNNPSPSKEMTLFGRSFFQDKFTDCDLRVHGAVFNCHRVVLAANSQYFESLVNKNYPWITITLSIPDSTAFRDLLLFIYCGEVVTKFEKEVFKLGQTLRIRGLYVEGAPECQSIRAVIKQGTKTEVSENRSLVDFLEKKQKRLQKRLDHAKPARSESNPTPKNPRISDVVDTVVVPNPQAMLPGTGSCLSKTKRETKPITAAISLAVIQICVLLPDARFVDYWRKIMPQIDATENTIVFLNTLHMRNREIKRHGYSATFPDGRSLPTMPDQAVVLLETEYNLKHHQKAAPPTRIKPTAAFLRLNKCLGPRVRRDTCPKAAPVPAQDHHVCLICGHYFVGHHNLKRHIACHTGEWAPPEVLVSMDRSDMEIFLGIGVDKEDVKERITAKVERVQRVVSFQNHVRAKATQTKVDKNDVTDVEKQEMSTLITAQLQMLHLAQDVILKRERNELERQAAEESHVDFSWADALRDLSE